jgi:Tfp pilus assembly protein PilF
MSKTLNLLDHLLARGRRYQRLGHERRASQILRRLAAFHALPPRVAEETQAQLAAISLRQRRFRKARRHLVSALAHRPASARYHYLMALAVARDPHADPQRAARHFRKSLRIDPEQPGCRSAYGALALRLGQTEEGLGSLRRAVEFAPQNVRALRRLVKGLEAARQFDEARRALQTALFLNAGDHRFRRLLENYQFRRLCREQAESRERRTDAESAPAILPFGRGCLKVVRNDGPSQSPGPHAQRPAALVRRQA